MDGVEFELVEEARVDFDFGDGRGNQSNSLMGQSRR